MDLLSAVLELGKQLLTEHFMDARAESSGALLCLCQAWARGSLSGPSPTAAAGNGTDRRQLLAQETCCTWYPQIHHGHF